jgi:hypothetical protein
MAETSCTASAPASSALMPSSGVATPPLTASEGARPCSSASRVQPQRELGARGELHLWFERHRARRVRLVEAVEEDETARARVVECRRQVAERRIERRQLHSHRNPHHARQVADGGDERVFDGRRRHPEIRGDVVVVELQRVCARLRDDLREPQPRFAGVAVEQAITGMPTAAFTLAMCCA